MAQPQQPYQGSYGAPYQQPMYQSPPPSDPMSSVYMMAFVGIILALIGIIILAYTVKIDTSDSYDTYETMQFVGNTLEAVGTLIVAVGILMGLMKAKQVSEQVKLGLLIALAIIVAWGL